MRPGYWAPSHRLWCSSEPPPRSRISLRLTTQAEVKVSFDFAKTKYKDSLQTLIDDFGFHPAFKRWFDEF